MARLFGALQTKEIRNEKVLQLDQRISEDENKIVQLQESLKYVREYPHAYSLPFLRIFNNVNAFVV